MRRLRALVRVETGTTSNVLMQRGSDGLEAVKIPCPVSLEAVLDGNAVYLLRLDGDGQCIADTWHETLEAAKEQARVEFGVERGEWKELDLN
jgi:hypothetical protein